MKMCGSSHGAGVYSFSVKCLDPKVSLEISLHASY